MADSSSYVELALKILGCSQKELALRLKVSPTQISKWKNGEYISVEMEKKIREMTGIGETEPSVILWAGSFEVAQKWDQLFHCLAEAADDDAETGYSTYFLNQDDGYEMLSWSTIHTLTKMGIPAARAFPAELEFALSQLTSSDDYSESEYEACWEALRKNPYTSAVSDIYKSLTDVYGFYAAYVQELIDNDDLNLLNTDADNIEPCLMDLAATKVEIDSIFASKFHAFRYEIEKDYRSWLTFVKDAAIKRGVPLRAELLDMVNKRRGILSEEAEMESLGLNDSRLHPDIYMNELLVGMRMIHQVLPAIMKKLEIYDDFRLDRSDLYNS